MQSIQFKIIFIKLTSSPRSLFFPSSEVQERCTQVWSSHVRPKIWDVPTNQLEGGAAKCVICLLYLSIANQNKSKSIWQLVTYMYAKRRSSASTLSGSESTSWFRQGYHFFRRTKNGFPKKLKLWDAESRETCEIWLNFCYRSSYLKLCLDIV